MFVEPPARALRRLLSPRSLAVVGGREAEEVIRQCDVLGFPGPVWPVNPNRSEMAGRHCVPSVGDLPDVPDAAFVAVPAEPTIDVVGALAAIGAGGAVCYASGFAEVGEEGRERQQRLVAAAAGMPLIGPNCYGAIDYLDGVALWPDQHGGRRVERGVAIVTQSGNMGLNMTMQRRSLSLAYMVTLGNQAVVGVADCLTALLDDERVTAIGLHIEGIADIPAFEAAARLALERRVPLIALKAGRSDAAGRLALSHTASITGRDSLYDALFERLGIPRMHSVPEFLETLKFLSIGGPLPGRRLASMSCSGGEASLMADAAEGRHLVFAELEPAHRAAVQATLNDYVEVSNPLDYHTFIWGQEPALTACFSAMLDGGFDATLLVLDVPRADRCRTDDWQVTANALTSAVERTGARAAVVATLGECLPEDFTGGLVERCIAPMHGIAEALTACEAAAQVGEAHHYQSAKPLLRVQPLAGTARALDEWEAKGRLRRAGITVPEGQVAWTVADAVRAAGTLGGRVAVKALSAELVHKTEAGALALGLEGPEAVSAAAERLLAMGDRVLVERMIDDAVAELIIGVERDPQFGPYVMIGSGGIMVELLRDVRTLLLPPAAGEVRRALATLKLAPLLNGFRGRPAADIAAIERTVGAIADFVAAHADRLETLEINPLMVRPAGLGVVAVDALLKLVDQE